MRCAPQSGFFISSAYQRRADPASSLPPSQWIVTSSASTAKTAQMPTHKGSGRMILRTFRIDGTSDIAGRRPSITVCELDAATQLAGRRKTDQLMSERRILIRKPDLRLEMARPKSPDETQ